MKLLASSDIHRDDIQTGVRFISAEEAVKEIPDAATIMVGGFGLIGLPFHLLQAVADRADLRDLTLITNNLYQQTPMYKMFVDNRINKLIGTYFTSNKEVVRAEREGRIDIELLPLGTFAEAIRLGGAGIAAFFTPTAAGTDLARDKESRFFGGREHILEQSLLADIALIKAYKADKAGNLIYRRTARNFNPVMATAAKLTIVEVEEVVEMGQLDPEAIVTPFIHVDIVVERGKGN